MRPSRRETASRRLGILRVSRSPSETGPSNRTSQFCARNGQTAVADLNSLEYCSLITCEELAIAGSASGANRSTLNPPIGAANRGRAADPPADRDYADHCREANAFSGLSLVVSACDE